ncbi:MAG: hypothetical protein M1840_002282 [Geoglossum simile]|nr:MAG: hypothetical protein M1840_002282 [Geoglossum simile]
MKFGQDLHLHQVPEWEPFYIHYRQLKRDFKSTVQKAFRSGTEPGFADLYASLSRDIDAFNKFYNDEYDFLLQKERQVCSHYSVEARIFAISDLEGVGNYELKALPEDFLELQQDLTKLQWFNRVNQHAVDKVFTKLEKFSEAVGQSHYDQKSRWLKSRLARETQLLKDAERLDKLAEDVRLAGSQNLYCQQSPSPSCFDTAYHAIRADQASDLAKLLEQKPMSDETHRSQHQEFLYGLLMFSITCQSRGCINFLLTEELSKSGVAMDHICLNHLIITTGRKNLPAHRDCSGTCTQPITDQIHGGVGTSMLIAMLEQLGSGRKGVLLAKDGLGRLSLHYGALYGLSTICQSILNSSGQDPAATSEAVLSVDSAGYTPLHYAVIRRYVEVARLFLDTLDRNYENGDEARNQHLGNLLGGLLIVALKYQYDDIVHLLITGRIDTSCHRSSCGETPLYVSAQIGREDYVKMLLEAAPRQNASIDVLETVYGRTPLLIACAEGHQAVVEHLLQAGASQSIVDYQGWTAQEHAAFRGHLAVAQTLETCKTGYDIGNLVKTPIKTATNTKHYLRADHSHIVANLGAMQKGKQVAAVNLSCYPSDYIHGLRTDSRFSIEVSVPGGSGPSRLVQLPIMDDMTNDPFVFSIKDASGAKLMFKIFCATSAQGQKGILVGSGIALLENYQHCFGAKRDSLIRERTIPILEKDTLNFMGTVTFTFVIAKPFVHPKPPPSRHVFSPPNPLLSDADPVVKGLGQNVSSRKRLQLGENTIEVDGALCGQVRQS